LWYGNWEAPRGQQGFVLAAWLCIIDCSCILLGMSMLDHLVHVGLAGLSLSAYVLG